MVTHTMRIDSKCEFVVDRSLLERGKVHSVVSKNKKLEILTES